MLLRVFVYEIRSQKRQKHHMYILGGGFNFQLLFIFTPISGEMIQIDDHIVQRGWFNHRLVCIYIYVFIYVDTKLRYA